MKSQEFFTVGSNSGQGLLGRWLTPDLNLNTSPTQGRCWNWQEEGMKLEMKGAGGGLRSTLSVFAGGKKARKCVLR